MSQQFYGASGKNKHNLRKVLLLTSTYLVAEVIGGLLTNSLALLADAAHMLTDVGGLALALFAIWMAQKPATSERTYGYYRFEILAALANALVLIIVSFYILYEAWERFRDPPEVASIGMFFIAVIGLGVNLFGIKLLRERASESLNLKGAYFEVLSDMLSSIGAIVAAAVIWTTGWSYADPLVSAGIGLFILPRTWRLLRDAVGVLLEGTPANVSLAEVRITLQAVPGVLSVHDLHVWSLTSGMNALSAHLVSNDGEFATTLQAATQAVKDKHAIQHVTLQVEPKGWEKCETHW